MFSSSMLSWGMDKLKRQAQAEAVIGRLGGPTALGAFCGITPQAVSQWKENGIPLGWEKFLRVARPDAFGEATSPAASADTATA